MFRRRSANRSRSGLVGTAARTAVVAGTAQSVAGKVARRQARQDAAEAPAPPGPQLPAAPPVDTDRLIEQLRQLGQLHADGILTDEEFATQKARLLA